MLPNASLFIPVNMKGQDGVNEFGRSGLIDTDVLESFLLIQLKA
jgi:hypothetical protein